MLVYNVRKLHRSRMLDAFLADKLSVDSSLASHTTARYDMQLIRCFFAIAELLVLCAMQNRTMGAT